jgi:hypothetical protein
MEYPLLPKDKKNRVINQMCIYKDRIVIWDGKELKCEHNRERSKCKSCGGSQICEHRKRRNECIDCGGSSICEHRKRRSRCIDCGGSQICEHRKHRSRCIDCGGSSICEHRKRRNQCIDCGGSQICEHRKLRNTCKLCGGSSICEHKKHRSRCIDCGGSSICEHKKERSRCKLCGGSSICEHGNRRSKCNLCDPNGYLVGLIRNRVYSALKNYKEGKKLHTMEYVGCNVEQLRNHLESQFVDGMTWENQGDWHIDHIRPCASFDLSNEDERQRCFHYTNLQPLWATDNLSKNDFYCEETFNKEWVGNMWIEKNEDEEDYEDEKDDS